ncbi:transposase domain-containing protein [Microbulbifer sp. 2205BS26-8]|nr:transposase domain-containing protein [Microbulbifer sp. 2205BS26-8]MDP5210107.1 transposase domain-containing protein [Microbulbifer sp. 2205BS26-8]
MIRTAKLHGLDPCRYYVKVLEKIPHCQSVEDYEVLLPWNIQLERVGVAAAA